MEGFVFVWLQLALGLVAKPMPSGFELGGPRVEYGEARNVRKLERRPFCVPVP